MVSLLIIGSFSVWVRLNELQLIWIFLLSLISFSSLSIVDQDGQASIRAPHVVLKPGSLGLLCPGQAMLAEDTDEEKGKHIGSGIYLKREGHLIKMTTPNFTVYY